MAHNDIKVHKENAQGTFDEIALAPADIAAAPASHTHGNLTNDGKIGTTAGLPVKTGTAGVLEAGAFGTAAGQFAEGDHTHEASDITDLTSAAAGALYDGALTTAGAIVSDANLRLINGNEDEVVLGYENITATRFINIPDDSGTLSLDGHTHTAADITDFTSAVEAVSPPADWDTLANKPSTFTPTAHASTHHTGGTDALAPSDIGAQTLFTTETLTVNGAVTLTAARAKNYSVIVAGNSTITLPTTGHLVGDIVVIRYTAGGGTLSVQGFGSGIGVTVNQQYRWIATGTGANQWALVNVDTHTHGNLTNDGKIGTTSGLPLKTGSGGVIEAGAFGTSAGQFCEGNDARLSDARTPSSTLAHAASHLAGIKASFSGQVGGMTSNVTIRANNVGTAGNSITLSFNGSNTVTQALATWNAANPSNQASLYVGDGSQVPDNGETITLSGGTAAGSDAFANINQNLGTIDSPEFAGLELNSPSNGEVLRIEGNAGGGNDVGFAVYNNTGDQANSFYFNRNNDYIGIGVGASRNYIQTTQPIDIDGEVDVASKILANSEIVLRDTDGGFAATFDVEEQLSADVTLTVPNASGVLALRNNIGGVVYDFYYNTAPAEATGSSGNWTFTVPSWSIYQLVTMIGAGGGGGSGRVDGAGTVCAGGAGGGSGAFGFYTTRIAGGSSLNIRIGAGGAGGAAQTNAIANGNAGSVGGDTYIALAPAMNQLRLASFYGRGGGGGGGLASLPISGAAGTGVTGSILGPGNVGSAGVAGSLTGNAGGGGNSNTTQGGRSGGSISAANVAYNGGLVQGAPFTDIPTSFYLPTMNPPIGWGAAGGNASTTANGGNGANAGGIGGGGGGGGAARSGFSSGAGGNGGNGFIRIVCF